MSDDVAALLIALSRENAELREQLAATQDMLVEAAIDAGNLYERLEAVQIECDAWRAEAERLEMQTAGRPTRCANNPLADEPRLLRLGQR